MAVKASAETERFEKKRQDVIDAASVLINELGVKGMTFADVAAEVGLNATSITYYFGRKEKLVVAVYEATLDRLEAMAAEAGAQGDPRSRVRHFLHANIELRKRIRRGERGLITVLAEMRTLDEDAQKPLLDHFRRISHCLRDFFGPASDPTGKALNIAPPGHEKTFDPLRDYWNHSQGWARPDDPERFRHVQLGHESHRSRPQTLNLQRYAFCRHRSLAGLLSLIPPPVGNNVICGTRRV